MHFEVPRMHLKFSAHAGPNSVEVESIKSYALPNVCASEKCFTLLGWGIFKMLR